MRPLRVAVVAADGTPSAEGLANLYREDLAKAKCGVGWCAFRLITDASPSRLRNGPLFLIEQRSGQLIHQTLRIDYVEADPADADAFDDLGAIDPYVLRSVEQFEFRANRFWRTSSARKGSRLSCAPPTSMCSGASSTVPARSITSRKYGAARSRPMR